MSNCEAADTYLCILHDEVHHAWLEKHIEEMSFSSLYDAPPLRESFLRISSYFHCSHNRTFIVLSDVLESNVQIEPLLMKSVMTVFSTHPRVIWYSHLGNHNSDNVIGVMGLPESTFLNKSHSKEVYYPTPTRYDTTRNEKEEHRFIEPFIAPHP